MKTRLELPIGVQFNALVFGRRIPLEVVAFANCNECAFTDNDEVCPLMECRGLHRKDGKTVVFKRIEGGKEG